MGVACSRGAPAQCPDDRPINRPSAKSRITSDDDAPDEERDYFLYTGQENLYIPRDVTHVRVHPSVKKIKAQAFQGCTWLRTAILNDGLEEIGFGAFYNCTSLVRIEIPPAISAIKYGTFCGCSRLTTMHLGDGLEDIEEGAFYGCTSLLRIEIPPLVRVIKHGAFAECSGLRTAILGDGLEEIEAYAFHACTSLVHITIPPTVGTINETAFNECLGLTNVVFCDEIEEFASGAGSMRDWWNNGVHEKCPSTYCFFVRCNIPERVGLVLPRMWHYKIHGMLRRIPSISPEGSQSYLRSIDSKLSVYDELKDVPALLELTIWKSKITERTDGNIDLLNADMKMECRTDSLSMVVIIVPNVLSFLADGDDGGDVFDDEEFRFFLPN